MACPRPGSGTTTEESKFFWYEPTNTCMQTTVTFIDGLYSDVATNVVDSSLCCQNANGDSQLMMACSDSVEVTYEWDEMQMMCTKTTVTNADA